MVKRWVVALLLPLALAISCFKGGDESSNADSQAFLAGASEVEVVVTALAIDPVTPRTLYAATRDDGVFKSTDGGSHWSFTGLADLHYLGSLVIDPRTPSTLYAASTWYDGVHKSTDGGAHWSVTGLANDDVVSLVIDARVPSTLYAGTYGRGFIKSTDGGASWAGTGFNVLRLVIDPKVPTLYGVNSSGVVKSDDAGETWSVILNNDLQAIEDESGELTITGHMVETLAVARPGLLGPSTLYAGAAGSVARSIDSGASWGAWVPLWFWYGAPRLAIDPMTPSTLYAVTYDKGVFKSTDSGETWSAVNVGLVDTLLAAGVVPNISALAIDPQDSSILYAGTNSGVFKSTDGAATWAITGLATRPDTAITSAVDKAGKAIPGGGGTTSTSITFRFTGSDRNGVAGFECKLDGAAFAPCSSPLKFNSVAKGSHTFQVRAVNNCGFRDPTPATFTWTRK